MDLAAVAIGIAMAGSASAGGQGWEGFVCCAGEGRVGGFLDAFFEVSEDSDLVEFLARQLVPVYACENGEQGHVRRSWERMLDAARERKKTLNIV